MSKVTPIAAANYLLGKGERLTPLQLIKLVYLCHGWSLAFGKGPLLTEQPQAWQYGPVLPSLYHAVKRFGGSPVEGQIPEDFGPTVEPDEHQKAVIDAVFDAYGDLTGIELSDLTHQAGTPWHDVWTRRGKNATIPDELIAQHFESLRHRAGQAA